MYYNHNLRTNLQEWKNRLYKSSFEQFPHQLKFSLSNIDNNKLLTGIIQEAVLKYSLDDETLNRTIEEMMQGPNEYSFENEMQHASFFFQILKHIIKAQGSYNLHMTSMFFAGEFEESKKNVIEICITPIFYYLHDQLDHSNSVTYLLEKYKKRTEWFTGNELLEKYNSVESNYEKLFEDDLRLFLFDQGIDNPFSTPK